ncbi:MAG: SIS domain-containing protein [Planctomycetota bacterium]
MKNSVLDMIQTHQELLDGFKKEGVETVTAAANMIVDSLKAGGCVYICGNGGSAADAQHIAGEFVGRFRRERKALPAVALSTDTSIITCIGNDYSFEDIFARQVEALVKESDILWAFSTSGSSANVIKAAKLAKERGAKVLAFTGKSNSELEEISDLCLCVNSKQTSSSQEIHQLAYHIICDLVEQDIVNTQ